MTYDFDMLSVVPKEIQSKYSNLFVRFGMQDQAAEQVAMFRDPETVSAISGASDVVRNCFVESGFALNGFDSHFDKGKYSAADADRRREVLDRLRTNLAGLPEDADLNGFDVSAFFAAAETASPFETAGANYRSNKAAVTAVPLAERITSRSLSTPAPTF